MTQRLDFSKAAPQGVRALGSVNVYLNQSGLPKSLIELVYLRVSQINGCAFCIDMHSRDLIKEGISIDKLVLVPAWREAGGLFSDQERAALGWAEAVTRLGNTGVSEADYNLAAASFNEKELTDLTIAIGLINAYNRLAISFRSTPAGVKS